MKMLEEHRLHQNVDVLLWGMEQYSHHQSVLSAQDDVAPSVTRIRVSVEMGATTEVFRKDEVEVLASELCSKRLS